MDAIKWDIRYNPDVELEDAFLDIPFVDRKRRKVTLLLPITPPPTPMVYYKEFIRTRSRVITRGDVLRRIYEFYNHRQVVVADIAALPPEMKTDVILRRVTNKVARFKEFIGPYTTIASVKPMVQNGGEEFFVIETTHNEE